MTQRVAVEEGLQQVSQYLEQQGCEVVDLSAEQLTDSECDCCVISGMDKDMMGIQDITSNISVINAQGMTPEEVFHAVQRSINRRQQ